MEREWQPNADIWIPAIRQAVRSLGGDESAVFLVFEKLRGEMTVLELESLIMESI